MKIFAYGLAAIFSLLLTSPLISQGGLRVPIDETTGREAKGPALEQAPAPAQEVTPVQYPLPPYAPNWEVKPTQQTQPQEAEKKDAVQPTAQQPPLPADLQRALRRESVANKVWNACANVTLDWFRQPMDAENEEDRGLSMNAPSLPILLSTIRARKKEALVDEFNTIVSSLIEKIFNDSEEYGPQILDQMDGKVRKALAPWFQKAKAELIE